MIDDDPCFHGSNVVNLRNGVYKTMESLKEGDFVLALDENGKLVHCEVILDLHQAPEEKTYFYQIQTDSRRLLTVTGNHLLYVLYDKNLLEKAIEFNNLPTKLAGRVKKGDYVLTHEQNYLRWEKVLDINVVERIGVYSPLTSCGNIIVDGVVASCYSNYESTNLIHFVFAPYRWLKAIKKFFIVDNENGIEESCYNEQKIMPQNWYAAALIEICKACGLCS